VNKYILRGGLYAAISFTLALYETLTHQPIRFELIAGYGLVFLFGIFTILSRHKRLDYKMDSAITDTDADDSTTS